MVAFLEELLHSLKTNVSEMLEKIYLRLIYYFHEWKFLEWEIWSRDWIWNWDLDLKLNLEFKLVIWNLFQCKTYHLSAAAAAADADADAVLSH